MMQKLGFVTAITLLLVTFMALTTGHKVFASWPGPPFPSQECDVLGDPSNGGTSDAACLSGQALANVSSLSGSGTSLIDAFVSDIEADAGSKYPVNKVGAAYIEAQLQQQGGNWITNMKQSSVTVTVLSAVPSSGAAPGFNPDENTGYDPATNSVKGNDNSPSGSNALAIYQNGLLVFVLRLKCGNVIGDLDGPKPQPNPAPPTGSVTVSCDTTNGTGLVKFNFSDSAGNTTAVLTVNYAGSTPPSGVFDYGTSGSYSRTIPAADVGGAWGATLVVQGLDGAAAKTYSDTSGKCSIPPTGALSLGCNADGTAYAIFKFSDVEGSTTATLNVNFAGTTPPNATYDFGTADSNGADHTYQIPDPNTDFAGAWGATLDINGVNGSDATSYTATSGTCDKPPVGTLTLSCNSNGTGVAKLSFSDPNGNTHAELTITYASGNAPPTGVSDYATSGSDSLTVPAGDLEGPWSASLLVYDYGGPNNVTVPATSKACSAPPTGTIQAAETGSCDAVRVTINDPYDTGDISYYLATPGNNKVLESPAPEGKLTPPADEAGTSVTNLAGFDYWKNNTIQLYAVDPLDTARTTGVLATVTLPGVCGQLSCTNSMTTLGADLVAGESAPFTVSAQMAGAPTGPPGATFTSITMQGPNGTTTIARGVGYNTDGYTLTDNANPSLSYTPPTAGSYTLTWSFGGGSDNTPAVTCSKTVQASYVPYFTVLGGDISAGQGFGSCTTTPPNPLADIKGENLDTGNGNYFGASSQMGAFATGAISNFATDTTNNLATDLGGSTDGITGNKPSGLAFANNPLAAGTYGGSLLSTSLPDTSSTAWCVPDYEGQAATPTSAFNPSNITSGTYSFAGGSLGGFTVPAGVHLTIVATGNVYINGNITYGAYSSVTGVPQFNLLLKGGSIYIANSVNDLHGFYDAEPAASGSNGVIYTCATSNGTPSNVYSTCNQPLTFYGAVAAKQLVLGRTSGNLVATGGVSNTPAEQFVFTPELWLGDLSTECSTNPSQSNCLYQSYTSLPPVL